MNMINNIILNIQLGFAAGYGHLTYRE